MRLLLCFILLVPHVYADELTEWPDTVEEEVREWYVKGCTEALVRLASTMTGRSGEDVKGDVIDAVKEDMEKNVQRVVKDVRHERDQLKRIMKILEHSKECQEATEQASLGYKEGWLNY